MVNPAILASYGSTRERFREVLTATGEQEVARKGESKEEKEERIKRNEQRDRDVKFRQKFTDLFQSRILNGIEYSIKNCKPYRAIDLAWDSIVLSKINMPLLLYAQGRIDVQNAATLLKETPNGDDYINYEAETDSAGKTIKKTVKSINLPKFIEAEVNMIRSMINRRWAAQKNKYSNLWPYYNYEPRSTGLVAKCRADVMSQLADIRVDQFGVRHHDSQVMLDGFLYGHSVDFVRCSWEVEKQLRLKKSDADPKDKNNYESYITKEGIGWVNPHPSRLFWDLSRPLSSLNSDTGCEYVGFWDVVKFSSIDNDPHYFNKTSIGFGNFWGSGGLFNQYQDYFNQYNYTINPPNVGNPGGSVDVAGENDAKSQGNFYSQTNRDMGVFKTEYFQKLIPKDWGVGDYPHPVWARIVVASDTVPIFAEFLPSRPGAVLSINENDSRAVSVSMAMDVMQFQQQMSNLLQHFMQLIEIEAFKAIGINSDMLTADEAEAIKKMLRAEDYYAKPLVYEFKLSEKIEQLAPGALKRSSEVINISEARQGQSINTVFDAMIKLLQLAERMNAMSAAESGQSEPREISATQTNVIANTTQTVYSSISDCIDDWREAKKIIIYESTVACQEGQLEVPVKNRYTAETIKAAGFEPKAGEDEDVKTPAKRRTVIGSAKSLVHAYIFSSRDGSERAVNTQAANTMGQLIGYTLAVPEVVKKMGKARLFGLFNEFFRMSGAGVDLNLELEEGEDDSFGEDEVVALKQTVDEITGMMQQLAGATQKNAQDIAGQTQVNAEQQEAIDLSAKMAEQLAKLATQVQELQASREQKPIEPPKISYERAPWSVQAQFERMNGLEPATDAERQKMLEIMKPKTTAITGV